MNITDNTITFVGNTDGTVVNNAVRVEGDDDEDDPAPASNIVVSGNTFDLALPSVDVAYDYTTWASTVMSEGIVFDYCSGVDFVNNTVDLIYNDVTTAYGYDSLYAVSVKSDAYTFDYDDEGELFYPIESSDILIADNTINVDGHACAYGIMIAADNFTVSGNNISVASETYLGHGIDVAAPSYDGNVDSNVIDVVANNAYGIVSDGSWLGPVDTVVYSNNNITVEGYGVAGMELMEKSPSVIDNTIDAEGNYTYGVVASIYDGAIISGNDIAVLGSNTGSDSTGDSLMPKNSMAITVKGDSLIEENTIYSTNVGICLVEAGEITVTNNTIAVVGNTDLMDNPGVVISKAIDQITVTYNTIITTGKYSVNVIDVDGTVNGNYLVSAKLIGDNSVYSNGSATVYNNTPLMKVVLFASDLDKVYNDGQLFVVAALDENGDPLVNATLIATIDSDEFDAITNENGIAEFDIELPEGTYAVITTFDGDEVYAFRSIENTLTVTAKETEFVADAEMNVSTADIKEGPVYFNLTLTDVDGNVLSNMTVIVEFDDVGGEFVTDDEGVVSYDITSGAGEYELKMIFNGDGCYAASNASAVINIIPVETSISADSNMTVLVSEIEAGAYFNLTLVAGDEVLSNQTVVISFANETDKFTTDDNGVISYKLPEVSTGNYTIEMVYAGDDVYNGSNASAIVNVQTQRTKLYLRNALFYIGQNEILRVVLWDSNAKPIANKEVSVTVDGKTYTGITDDNGTAYIRVLVGVGTFEATINFAGDSQYSASSQVGSVRVYKEPAVLGVKYTSFKASAATKTVQLTLWNRQGKPLPTNTKLAFKVNGKTYTGFTDSNGIVKINININKAGTYNAQAIFLGNSWYAERTTATKIVIS